MKVYPAMNSFTIDVSEEDFALLQHLRHLGYDIMLDLDVNTGGVTVRKGGSSVEWAFISEVDGPNGKTYDDHRTAIIALCDADASTAKGAK